MVLILVEVGAGAIASNEGTIKNDVTVKADGELSITGDGVIEGNVTVYPGGELRANNSDEQTGHPKVNGEIILEYEDKADLQRMKEILEDSGIIYDESQITERQHIHSTEADPKGTDDTCTEPGVSYKECGTCGRQYNVQILEALGHDWQEVTLQAQSCTEDEIKVKHCARECGVEDIPVPSANLATGHTLVMEQENGKVVFKCSKENCGYSFEVAFAPSEECEHSWSTTGTQKRAPSCIQAGIMTYSCSNCDAKLEVSIPMVGHTPDGIPTEETVEEPGCTTDGFIDTVQHCSVCPAIIESTRARTIVPAEGHQWGEWIYDAARLCTDQGSRTRVCSICGTEEIELYRATAHT